MTLTEIFKNVIYFSAMGTIVVFVVLFTRMTIGKQMGAKKQCFLWLISLVRLAVPFSFSSIYSIFNVFNLFGHNVNKYIYVEDTYTNQTTAVAGAGQTASQPVLLDVLVQYAAILWIAGILFLTAFYAFNYIVLLKKINRCEQCTDSRVLEILSNAKHLTKTKKNVPIIFFEGIHSPSLIGVFKHRILISKEMLYSFSDEQLKYVFLHEMSHLKRGDIIISWIMKLVCAVHWFNPFVWYAQKKMLQDVELACDEKVLCILNKKEYVNYGETIIAVITNLSSNRVLIGTTALSVRKSNIKRRILHVGFFKPSSNAAKAISFAILFAVGAVCLTTAPASYANYNAKNESEKSDFLMPPLTRNENNRNVFTEDSDLGNIYASAEVSYDDTNTEDAGSDVNDTAVEQVSSSNTGGTVDAGRHRNAATSGNTNGRPSQNITPIETQNPADNSVETVSDLGSVASANVPDTANMSDSEPVVNSTSLPETTDNQQSSASNLPAQEQVTNNSQYLSVERVTFSSENSESDTADFQSSADSSINAVSFR